MPLDLSSHHLGLDLGENGFAYCQTQAERSGRTSSARSHAVTSHSIHSPDASSAVNFSLHFKGYDWPYPISLENRRRTQIR